ncbi:MAG: carbohydrate binding family 9 domain-containing protein [Acidobacteria bacterium]|nr:carbohydrate binding family 9 domain-containing protein [Acidobacteriota bacterium]
MVHRHSAKVERSVRVLLITALAVAGGGRVDAQTSTREEKTLRALTTSAPIRVDGRLDEPDWLRAEVISDFVQQEPRVGEKITERTEVRVLLDAESIYFGIWCYDSDPSRIIAREFRRDQTRNTAPEDQFDIILDTFHDHRNAYHFGINPLGTQYDAVVTDEGQDVNVEWDERWWAETTRAEDGWRAEIRIPLRALRSRAGTNTFGINFRRFIRRKNETAFWSGWNRDFNFLQVSQAGQLSGMEQARTGLKLRVKPYVLGGFTDPTPGGSPTYRALRDVGIETLKVSLTPGLTAELTVNTDFAQAEVDDAVVNLSRFPLFFPEKREFFLERAGIFEFGLGGRRGGDTERNLQMFFSRRIGLTPDRRPVPILGGAKVTGRTGGFDVGVLNVQTDSYLAPGSTDANEVPGSNYTVFRGKRNVLARSNVGMFLSNRQSSNGDYNRVVGADANFTVFRNTDIQGFIGRSMTPGRDGNDLVGRVKYNWLTDLYEVFVEHLYIGPEFQHDVGFVRRNNIERTDMTGVWEPRPGRFNIRNFVFRGQLVYLTDTKQSLLTREQIFATTTRFQNDDVVRSSVTNTFDRVEAPFEIAPGIIVPAADYHFVDTWVEGEGGGKRPLLGKVRVGGGGFYGGQRRYVRFTPAWRPSRMLSFEPAYEINDVELPQGSFRSHVVNARMNLNLSNRWLTTTLVQYDNTARRSQYYARLNYIYRPGDDIFIVFNQSRERVPGLRGKPDRSLMLKMTYSLDF